MSTGSKLTIWLNRGTSLNHKSEYIVVFKESATPEQVEQYAKSVENNGMPTKNLF